MAWVLLCAVITEGSPGLTITGLGRFVLSVQEQLNPNLKNIVVVGVVLW